MSSGIVARAKSALKSAEVTQGRSSTAGPLNQQSKVGRPETIHETNLSYSPPSSSSSSRPAGNSRQAVAPPSQVKVTNESAKASDPAPQQRRHPQQELKQKENEGPEINKHSRQRVNASSDASSEHSATSSPEPGNAMAKKREAAVKKKAQVSISLVPIDTLTLLMTYKGLVYKGY